MPFHYADVSRILPGNLSYTTYHTLLLVSLFIIIVCPKYTFKSIFKFIALKKNQPSRSSTIPQCQEQ